MGCIGSTGGSRMPARLWIRCTTQRFHQTVKKRRVFSTFRSDVRFFSRQRETRVYARTVKCPFRTPPSENRKSLGRTLSRCSQWRSKIHCVSCVWSIASLPGEESAIPSVCVNKLFNRSAKWGRLPALLRKSADEGPLFDPKRSEGASESRSAVGLLHHRPVLFSQWEARDIGQ